MSLQGCNVVVAGGGIGGMTAALLLGSAGASVRLLERVAKPAAVGAGILLQPNGLAVLYALGLGEALRRAAWRTPPAAIRDPAGRSCWSCRCLTSAAGWTTRCCCAAATCTWM